MKSPLRPLQSLALIVSAATGFATSTMAAISAINSGATNAQLAFDDTNSQNSVAASGTTIYATNQSVWSGNPLGLTVVDPVTSDSAAFAFRAFGWNFPQAATPYGLNLQNFTVTQQPGGSGFVEATITFRIQYQIDGGGLNITNLFLPQYLVGGTVQTGGFAMVTGQVDYTSAALGAMEQVNYGYFNNTPGTFTSQPLVGTPVLNATAFALPSSDTLTIGGYFTAKVDPASITITTVPEPGVALLCAPAALALLAGCRRRHAVGKE
jgi:hypothetical protein